jgi:phosphoglycerate dehydrogenase-like enzyme
MNSFTIFVTRRFGAQAQQALEAGASAHRLIIEGDDAALRSADIAFGQPNVTALVESSSLRWAHISSAGYTTYDRNEVKNALQARGAMLTNSSHVYDEPCAQHAAAMILALARQLPQCWDEQQKQLWKGGERRAQSFLLNEQTVLFLGFGAIGRLLAAMLAPYNMKMLALRRQPRGDEGIEVISEAQLDDALARADHIVNLLPENEATRGFVSAARIKGMKAGARYYSIGRGITTEQDALIAALNSGHLGAAYLDVMVPEPLPPEHPLWTTPNCFITPHSAGGHIGEELRLVQHFLNNLRSFEIGQELVDRVI